MNNPVGFCSEFCSYYLRVSWFGIKYRKQFATAEEAINFSIDHPDRCLDVKEEITSDIKDKWLKELRGFHKSSKCSYKFFRPVLSWFFVCFLIWFLGVYLDKLHASRGVYDMTHLILGLVVYVSSYVSFFANSFFAIYVAWKVFKCFLYRKIIARNCG